MSLIAQIARSTNPRRPLGAKMPQGSALVQGDMIGFVAFNLVLWIVCARVMDIAFVVHIPRVHAHDTAADPAGFGIPTHVIANFEYLRHDESPKTYEARLACIVGRTTTSSALASVISRLASRDDFFRIRALNMMCLRKGNHSDQRLTILMRALVKTCPA